jgi:hypothetical protein
LLGGVRAKPVASAPCWFTAGVTRGAVLVTLVVACVFQALLAEGLVAVALAGVFVLLHVPPEEVLFAAGRVVTVVVAALFRTVVFGLLSEEQPPFKLIPARTRPAQAIRGIFPMASPLFPE